MRTDDVRDRMGVYKRLSDVPLERRLEQFESSYTNQDVWAEYVASEDRSDHAHYRLDLVESSWKGHMSEAGRHHALADPVHIEEWGKSLIEDKSIVTAYSHYWTYLAQFYHWLM